MTSTKKPASTGRKRAKYQEVPSPASIESLEQPVETAEPEAIQAQSLEQETKAESSTALVPAIATLVRDKDEDEVVVERVEHLNKGVGWILISAGIVGMVVPGVLGTPFLIMGGLALWPGNRKRVERWRQGHSPKMFHGAMKQINRFLDDLEKRYPHIDKR